MRQIIVLVLAAVLLTAAIPVVDAGIFGVHLLVAGGGTASAGGAARITPVVDEPMDDRDLRD